MGWLRMEHRYLVGLLTGGLSAVSSSLTQAGAPGLAGALVGALALPPRAFGRRFVPCLGALGAVHHAAAHAAGKSADPGGAAAAVVLA